ncbi:MAG: prolyl oligopeptidase family serine peptidase [Actinomycetota bacterium]
MPATAATPRWEQRFLAATQTFPHWSRTAPDRLAFTSDEEGSFQAYAWDRASGHPRRLSDEHVGVDVATVSGDGSEVVWFSDPTGDESGRWIAVPFSGGQGRDVFPGAPVGWPEGLAVGRELAVGVIADRDGFALYVSERGEPAREVHRDADQISFSATDYHLEGADRVGLSADESLVCIEVAQDGDNIHHALRVLDPRTGATVGVLADGPGLGLSAFAWSPVHGDGRLLVGHEREDHMRPAIWDPASGERVDLSLELPGEAIPVDWWPDASAVLIVHLFRGRDRLYRCDLATGALTEILHPAGEVLGAGVRPDGQVWFRVASGDRASRVLSGDGEEVLAAPDRGVRDGRPYREWLFRNPSGDTIHGWVVTPEGDGPFPTYLKVHGGPNWLYLDTWWPDVQMLVDHGFAVAMVNYRGSIGYGRTFRDHIVGNIGFPEVEDVVAGLDDLVARGVADPARAVVGGWSWGGYITLLALGTHPDRFLAGVAGVPVGDYMGSYDDSAPSLQAYDRSLIGGVVHDVPEFVAERSPITYVDRVRAPVLVLVGEHDSRCVPAQVHAYVDALRTAGGDAELYSYDEGHSSYIVEEEVREWRTVLEFLLRRVPLP